jgi:hypothetical protein
VHLSYNASLLRCFPALSLYASLIRDQKGAADTARPVRPLASGRDGLDAPALSRRFQHRNLRNYLNSQGGPTDRGCDLEELQGSLSETPETPETSRAADGSACTAQWLLGQPATNR